MINFQNAMAMIQAIKNPQQMLANMGIPQEHLSSPDSAAQYLLNSGRVNLSGCDTPKYRRAGIVS